MHNALIIVLGCLLLIWTQVGSSWACTSFCMDTPDGPVFAVNLDLLIPGDGLVFVNQRGIAKESGRKGATGKTLMWTSKYGSVSFNFAGREVPWSGMNEAGLVISGMELEAGEFPEPDERPPLDIGSWT
jgi:penicillin V acylase-like amidase (Ntn superfamily)